MKKHLLVATFIGWYTAAWPHDTLSVCSSSGKIFVKIWMEENLKYRIYDNGSSVLESSDIDMILPGNNSFSFNNSIRSFSVKKESREIISPVPEKRKNHS